MKDKKRLVVLYTRINGVERVQVEPGLDSRLTTPAANKLSAGDPGRGNDGEAKQGMEINREFHEALGLKAGGVR